MQPAEVSHMPPYRVLVAGSRNFDDNALLCSGLDWVLTRKENVVIAPAARRAPTAWASGTPRSVVSASSSTSLTGSGTGAGSVRT